MDARNLSSGNSRCPCLADRRQNEAGQHVCVVVECPRLPLGLNMVGQKRLREIGDRHGVPRLKLFRLWVLAHLDARTQPVRLPPRLVRREVGGAPNSDPSLRRASAALASPVFKDPRLAARREHAEPEALHAALACVEPRVAAFLGFSGVDGPLGQFARCHALFPLGRHRVATASGNSRKPEATT